jgi:hypothetical protein
MLRAETLPRYLGAPINVLRPHQPPQPFSLAGTPKRQLISLITWWKKRAQGWGCIRELMFVKETEFECLFGQAGRLSPDRIQPQRLPTHFTISSPNHSIKHGFSLYLQSP